MNEFSILIGGKAGFGIDKASLVIANLMGRLGYRIYVYRDYPSLIRGGHTFSIIRASTEKVAAGREKIDVLLALNKDAVDLHKGILKDDGFLLYDSDVIGADSITGIRNVLGLGMTGFVKDEGSDDIMRNTCIIGAFARASGIGWDLLEATLRKDISKELDRNLKIAHRGFDSSKEFFKIDNLAKTKAPLVTGNEALALGLIRSGLDSYISYPMTPSSPILHYLANLAEDAGIKVIHPESELAVIMMALGMSYSGKKVAVGTAGGGFCLMTEGLSFSGMAELPVVIVLGQRPGPSTGLPTYSCQTELDFALSAGHGEFSRFVIAPSDAEEAYFAARLAMRISWLYQIPSIILTDKAMAEGCYSFDIDNCVDVKDPTAAIWDKRGAYKRYMNSDDGVSPMAFPGEKNAVVKISSYEHDEAGISTEDPAITVTMQDKRLRKEKYMAIELESYECVKVRGNISSETAILCWGSNAGVCIEVATKLSLKVIQPVVLSPFPAKRYAEALEGTKKIISVENNATGQLARLSGAHGIPVKEMILKYDGRNFTVEELEDRLRKVIG